MQLIFTSGPGSTKSGMDHFIQRINPYPVDNIGAFLIFIGHRANCVHWIGIYPLAKVFHSLYSRALFYYFYTSPYCICDRYCYYYQLSCYSFFTLSTDVNISGFADTNLLAKSSTPVLSGSLGDQSSKQTSPTFPCADSSYEERPSRMSPNSNIRSITNPGYFSPDGSNSNIGSASMTGDLRASSTADRSFGRTGIALDNGTENRMNNTFPTSRNGAFGNLDRLFEDESDDEWANISVLENVWNGSRNLSSAVERIERESPAKTLSNPVPAMAFGGSMSTSVTPSRPRIRNDSFDRK